MAEKVEEKQGKTEELTPDETKVEPLQKRLLQLVQDEQLDESEVLRVVNDKYFVRRCLISSLNDEHKAYKMATNCCRWRHKLKPSQLSTKDFERSAAQGVYAFCGYAKNGWPIIYGKACEFWPWAFSTEEYAKQIAWLYETAERAMDPNDPYARAYFIMDMKGMSKLSADLRKIATLAKISCYYYPERVMAVALNADLLTMGLWKFMSPLLDTRTRDRVHILRHDYHDFLTKHVGLENVGPFSGGTRAEEWPIVTDETAAAFRWKSSGFKRHGTDETQASEQEGDAEAKIN